MLYPHLFSPGRIGSLELPNRIVKAPTSTGLSNADGTVSERLIRHYRSQASGGVGLLIVEYAFVDQIASKSAHCQLGISTDDHIPGLAWLADTIREAGAVPGIQLEHAGRQKFLGTPPIKSCSAVVWPALHARKGDGAVPEVLTLAEIDAVVEAFGDSALRAVMAGFELVEIHGAHGYLLTNFLSPHTNKRTDQYGGTLENRMRFVLRVAENVRRKVGPAFPVTIRLSGSDYEPDGFGVEETIEVAKALQAAGIDAIHVSGGDHHQMIHQVSPMCIPRAHNIWAAEAIKRHVSIPVIGSGSITMPDLAEDILASGKADYIGIARPMFADPEWSRKAREGRPEDIRPCIRCNEGCLEKSFFKYRSVMCSVNATLGREGELEIIPTARPRQIAVIGGGVAGLEFARVAALRGHHVTLFEANRLGGMLHEGGTPDFKSDIRYLRENMVSQVRKLDVAIVDARADSDTVARGNFEMAVVAVGAAPKPLDVKTDGSVTVCDAVDVLAGRVKAGRRVAVLGAGLVGTETALWLDEAGHEVVLLHKYAELMRNTPITDKIAYSEMLATTDIRVMAPVRLVAIGDGVLRVEEEGGMVTTVAVDNLVTAIGYAPRRDIAAELRARGNVEVHEIGDCTTVGRVFDAIHAAYRLARDV